VAHRACTNCGAPLAGPSRVCEFCGVEQAPDPPPPPPPQPIVQPFRSPAYVPPQQQGAKAGAAAVVGGVITLGAVGMAIALSTAGSRSSTPPTIPNISIPPIPTVNLPNKTVVPISALHTTKLTWTESVAIERTDMLGTLDKFDPLANWDWALSVGRGWWSDAEMYTLDLDPIEKDGTVNATAESARAEFHLVSKACEQDRAKRAETEKDAKDNSSSISSTRPAS
jgi:hypothetical protein